MEPRVWTRYRIRFADWILPFNPTDDTRFNPSHFASLSWVQGLDDGKPHCLWIDDIRIMNEKEESDLANPPALKGLVVHGFERHFELDWQHVADPHVIQYQILRSLDMSNPEIPPMLKAIGFKPN